jgi:P-type Cu+ transporter
LVDLAGSLERASEHPLGAAMVAYANERELGFMPVNDVEAAVGGGVRGTVQTAGGPRMVAIGSARWLATDGVDVSQVEVALESAGSGHTTVVVAIDERAAGVISITDPVRVEASAAVRELAEAGIEVWLVSGDGRAAANAVGSQVGIPVHRIVAEVRPEGKAAIVARLQERGRTVAMVGDGINDAPALARADVGIAIGTGTDIAIETAPIPLMGADPRGVPAAIGLSRATMTTVRQNLFWAFAYNVVLIPIAMGILVPSFGISLSPALAAGAMAFSSVTVVANALRLRTYDARPDAVHRTPRGRLGRLREASFLAAIALAALGVAGGVMAADRWVDAGAEHVTVVAREARFQPADVTIPAGRTVVLTFRNEDPVFHDWEVEGLANVDAGARPGQTQRLRFRIDEPGSYRIVCTVPGHAEAGMAGTLRVDPAD